MHQQSVVGLTPLWPWPLSRWRWLAAPVRAERLAALRIGLALVLLIDVLTTYLPKAALFFGEGGFADGGAFDYHIARPKHWPPRNWEQLKEDWDDPPTRWYWSLLSQKGE